MKNVHFCLNFFNRMHLFCQSIILFTTYKIQIHDKFSRNHILFFVENNNKNFVIRKNIYGYCPLFSFYHAHLRFWLIFTKQSDLWDKSCQRVFFLTLHKWENYGVRSIKLIFLFAGEILRVCQKPLPKQPWKFSTENIQKTF